MMVDSYMLLGNFDILIVQGMLHSHLLGSGHDSLWMKRELPYLEEDGVLWRLLSEGYAAICKKIPLASQDLLLNLLDPEFRIQNLDLLDQGFDPEANAAFYQALKLQVGGDGRVREPREVLLSSLDNLLKNNLMLDLTRCNAGGGQHEDYFLCADVPDEKMPWDTEESDW
jgi:hypothetical protein